MMTHALFIAMPRRALSSFSYHYASAAGHWLVPTTYREQSHNLKDSHRAIHAGGAFFVPQIA